MSRSLCHLAFRSARKFAGHIRLDLAAAVVVLLAAFPVGASAAQKGINTDLDWGTTSTTQTQTANVVQDSGATWTRLSISWSQAEPKRGTYSSSYLSSLDNAVSLMQARSVQIEVVVNQSPQWETGNSNANTPPANNSDFASFLSTMVARYKGKISAYEIWNEENIQRFWPTGPNAAQYAALLKASFPAVKSVDPNAKVVFGGLALNDYSYLQAVYAAAPNIGNYFDVMAVHPYTNNAAPPDLTVRDSNGMIDPASFDGYKVVNQVMLGHGDNKPIWFTEFGWSTCSTNCQSGLGGVSLAQQASYVTLAYQCIEQDPYVQVAYWYNLRDNYWANEDGTWDDELGLLYTDFTPKPAYGAYKAYTPGNTGCTYHEQDGTPTPADGSLPPSGGTRSGGAMSTTATSTTGTTAFQAYQPSASASTASSPRVPQGAAVTRTRTTLRFIVGVLARTAFAAARANSSRSTLIGRVIQARSPGSVSILLATKGRGSRWHRVARITVKLSRTGGFKVSLGCRVHLAMRAGTRIRVRADAIYSGAPGYSPSSSPAVYLWAKRPTRGWGGCSQVIAG